MPSDQNPEPEAPAYRWLAVLETMWDWEARTSAAGYEKAPDFFCINPRNFTGRRLYRWTGEEPGTLWCTNACGELVSGPQHHGTPDVDRLARNLARWQELVWKKRVRGVGGREQLLYVPHPAARTWTAAALRRVEWFVREGKADLRMRLQKGGRLSVRTF